MRQLLKSRRVIQGLAILLIVIGVSQLTQYGRGAFDAYRRMQFATEHNFDAGNVDVALVAPWMNIRYIAEAYAVPQIFIFDELGVEMERRTSELPLGRLNNRLRLGRSSEEPPIIEMVRQAIEKYRSNPVVTGLAEGRVRPWMNVQYIANSTGIPVETFFAEVGLPVEGNAYKPLGWLVDSTDFEPGEDELIKRLQRVVDENGGPSESERPSEREGASP